MSGSESSKTVDEEDSTLESGTDDFESTHWDPEGTPVTPAITPGVFTSSARVDVDGNPIVSKLTFGVHWNESSFPAWNKRERRDDSLCAVETPSSVLKGSDRPHVCQEPQAAPIDVQHIADMFDQVRSVFGFQFHSEINIFELLMSQLDSRASRSDPDVALRSLHADYIGGPHSNYRKWLVGSQMDLLDHSDTLQNMGLAQSPTSKASKRREFVVLQSDVGFDVQTLTHRYNFRKVDINDDEKAGSVSPTSVASEGLASSTISYQDEELTLEQSNLNWIQKMQDLSDEERMLDLIIYLMCWGEANQVRYMPECLAFIYKCARDYYSVAKEELPEYFYLEKVITPLYRCYRSQNFDPVEGGYKKREADHQHIIGYDDMNQLFWYRKSLESLKSGDKSLLSLPRGDRFLAMQNIDWTSSFQKTYREVRTWLHLVVNFSRIWIIHGSVFWYYTAFNSAPLYTPRYRRHDSETQTHIQLSIVSLGGAIGPLLTMIALILEMWFVPRGFAGAEPVIPRLLVTTFMLVLVIAPSVFTLCFTAWDSANSFATVLSSFQLVLAVLYTLYFGITPLGSLIGTRFKEAKRRFLPNRYFTSDFQLLTRNDQNISWMVSILVFAAKLTESYFFLTLSLKDPVLELSLLSVTDKCVGDLAFGPVLCRTIPLILLMCILVTDMILFLLDTYLWYVIINTLVSIIISFYGGASVWTPWRNIYSRLPQRIKSKILTTTSDQALKMLWNSIIESMYDESLLTSDQARKLMYTLHRARVGGGDSTVVEPAFFTSEEDRSLEASIFKSTCEAHRRISFFAQSLATPIPEPLSVQEMPTFTVLVPHYSEKIFLTLRETIRQDNESSTVTILEYLQRLHPTEWDCFVKKSRDLATQYREHVVSNVTPKVVSTESDTSDIPFTLIGSDLESDNFDIPFKKLGFVTSLPVETNRVRMWGSSHTQTLYRTIDGFMKYATAIKVLCFSENDAVRNAYMPKKDIIHLIDSLIQRKFRLLISMQRFDSFSDAERNDVIALLQQFPNLSLVYVEEIKGSDGEESTFYSTLLDSTCVENGAYQEPRLRVRISGNPILGDGKSDNQNHSLIYYRGEYIQLVDSNQDHYLEECIKIRNVLMEFDERELPSNPYVKDDLVPPPVAIVGAREYIFSENIGVLGDVAAGKEQTFGTLSARTLAKIGSKLHYGHPDFLNAVFMTTRGGVSKAQKGLHLNEDIYAGMMALSRGGRIKHSEYIQCGKGRDLGFVSILNFTSKIGAGMGEQMLSREYFYLGTQLPIERFISFYYAHPGFHINNVLIIFSLQLFLTCLLILASIRFTSTLCDPSKVSSAVELYYDHCQNLIPILHWVNRCVVSIFLVFFITLLPLFVQELAEKGLWRSVSRIGNHFLSMSMLFEIFVCRIYAISFIQDMNLGGAKYIATGRGFATSRTPFHVLYSGYAPSSLYFGLKSFLVLLYATIVFWHPSLLWFWVTTVALIFSPILFNPHQFSRLRFFMDYGRLLKWFSRIDSTDSWQSYVRSNTGKLTGYKRSTGTEDAPANRPNFFKVLLCRLIPDVIALAVVLIPYVYVGSQRSSKFQRLPQKNPILRITICACGPYFVNLVILLFGHIVSLTICLGLRKRRAKLMSAAAVIASTVRILGVFVQAAFLALLYLLEKGSIPNVLLGYLVILSMQGFVNSLIVTCVLSRQRPREETSTPWWTGDWHSTCLGARVVPVIFNELLAKTVESTQFVTDYLLCHTILAAQVPLLLIPYINKVHSLLLLWLNLDTEFPVAFQKAKQQRLSAQKYFLLFFITTSLLVGLFIAPVVTPHFGELVKYIDFVPGIVA